MLSKIVIGKSWLMKDIFALKTGSGRKKLLVCASPDAEIGTVSNAVTMFAEGLCERNTSLFGFNVGRVSEKTEIFCLPQPNPDGNALLKRKVRRRDDREKRKLSVFFFFRSSRKTPENILRLRKHFFLSFRKKKRLFVSLDTVGTQNSGSRTLRDARPRFRTRIFGRDASFGVPLTYCEKRRNMLEYGYKIIRRRRYVQNTDCGRRRRTSSTFFESAYQKRLLRHGRVERQRGAYGA